MRCQFSDSLPLLGYLLRRQQLSHAAKSEVRDAWTVDLMMGTLLAV